VKRLKHKKGGSSVDYFTHTRWIIFKIFNASQPYYAYWVQDTDTDFALVCCLKTGSKAKFHSVKIIFALNENPALF